MSWAYPDGLPKHLYPVVDQWNLEHAAIYAEVVRLKTLQENRLQDFKIMNNEICKLSDRTEAAERQLREARLAVRERDIWKLAAQEKGIADLHSAERILHNTLMYAEGYRSAELAYDPLYAALSMLVRIIEGIECWHEASDELVKAVDTARKLLGRR
jgi:hypothetical protein